MTLFPGIRGPFGLGATGAARLPAGSAARLPRRHAAEARALSSTQRRCSTPNSGRRMAAVGEQIEEDTAASVRPSSASLRRPISTSRCWRSAATCSAGRRTSATSFAVLRRIPSRRAVTMIDTADALPGNRVPGHQGGNPESAIGERLRSSGARQYVSIATQASACRRRGMREAGAIAHRRCAPRRRSSRARHRADRPILHPSGRRGGRTGGDAQPPSPG